jgi:hypothetical protein
MKVALAFWGLTRSLKYTINSINEKIINILKKNNIEYKIFMHTWIVNSIYNNTRSHENNIVLDNEEYKLLNPDFVELHDQDEFKRQINFEAFRSKPDPWNTNYETVNNFICAMFSKSKCTQLISNSGEQFDYIIFLRPDCAYYTKLDVNFFKLINNNTICIPNFALHNNFNDRFCLTNMNTYKIYGNVFSKMFMYSKRFPLHSETFNYHIMKINKINIRKINFVFKRVRADGNIVDT